MFKTTENHHTEYVFMLPPTISLAPQCPPPLLWFYNCHSACDCGTQTSWQVKQCSETVLLMAVSHV